MQLNTPKVYSVHTHEGGPAFPYLTPEQTLVRSTMSCLLWEKSFYEDGVDIADRIVENVRLCKPEVVAALAIDAKEEYKLRHAPLLLTAALVKHNGEAGTARVRLRLKDIIADIITRADELCEFLAIYAKLNGVEPKAVKKKLSAQVKKGLAKAFDKFDEYQLAKYDRAKAITLRDAMFLCHPKPKTPEREALYKRLAQKDLATPDTWEVNLSAGKDKKETFERLLRERKLGELAFLRNLRNMSDAGVDEKLVEEVFWDKAGKKTKLLPFQFVAAARACPRWEKHIDDALLACTRELPTFKGRTVVLVDVSGSMDDKLSEKSQLSRMDAAGAIAMMVKSDSLRIFTFSNALMEVPARGGMGLVDVIKASQPHSGTALKQAIDTLHDIAKVTYDRIILITDEQSSDGITDPRGRGYCINVGTCRNGVGYGKWTNITGFSERVVKFIHEREKQTAFEHAQISSASVDR